MAVAYLTSHYYIQGNFGNDLCIYRSIQMITAVHFCNKDFVMLPTVMSVVLFSSFHNLSFAFFQYTETHYKHVWSNKSYESCF
jgi:hypothetical protein